MKRHLLLAFSIVILFSFSSCVSISNTVVERALNRQYYDDGSNLINRDTFMASVESSTSQEVVEKHKQEFLSTVSEIEQWTITANDGVSLVADFYPNHDSHLYLITAHGLLNEGTQMLNHASYFADWERWNFLTPDCRAHGKSGGKYLCLGYLDRYDYLKWIDKVIEYDEKAQIVLLGQSFGSSTMLMVSSSENLPSNVKCVISDCGYSSAYKVGQSLLNTNHLDILLPSLDLIDYSVRHIAGFSLKEASPCDVLCNCKIPVLFIHGSDDKLINPSMTYENAKALKDTPYEILIVQSAGHGQSLFTDPQLYSTTVKNFVQKYLSL